MKRRNQGYVLVLALVVTLLLTSVASLIAMTTYRNVEAGGSDLVRMQRQNCASAMMEEYFAHLKLVEGEEIQDASVSAVETAFASRLNDFADDENDNRFQSALSYPGYTLTIEPVSHTEGSQEYFVDLSVSYTEAGTTTEMAASTIRLIVTIKADDPDNPDTTTYSGIVKSVAYTAYRIAG